MKKIVLKPVYSLLALFLLVACSGGDDIPIVVPDPIPIPIPAVKSIISFNNPGQLIDAFFYDIKQGNRAITSIAMATEIFVNDDANGIRIPIFGNINKPAHPSEGVVVDEPYEGIINSINLAKAARGTKGFTIFASKKLDGTDSFPAWVKDSNGIIPENYAILLADFIEYMITKNIQIDYLGIDNEFVYNEGNITPQKYSETIDHLRNLANTRGFDMPLLLGYDDYGPNKRNWVKTIMDNGWGDKMDVYGTHYYPQWRPMDKLLADLALIGNRPFWSTEPHWDAKSDVDDLDEAEAGMVTFWDQIDVGMSGFMWWNYELTGLRGKLMRAVSVPMLGARPIKITDVDGESITNLGNLQTRAFIEDKTITVYVVNMHSNNSYQDYGFKLEGSKITSNVNYKQWTSTTSEDGNRSAISPLGDNENIFTLTLPKRSITRFTFNIQ